MYNFELLFDVTADHWLCVLTYSGNVFHILLATENAGLENDCPNNDFSKFLGCF